MLTEGTSSNSADFQTVSVCLKLIAGGWKKEVCKRLVPWTGWVAGEENGHCCSIFLSAPRWIFSMSAVHSTLYQGRSFYILRMLNTCLIASKVLQTSLLVGDSYRKWRGYLELTAPAFCMARFLEPACLNEWRMTFNGEKHSWVDHTVWSEMCCGLSCHLWLIQPSFWWVATTNDPACVAVSV